jgi:lysyl-tRNA synthetase, class II
LLVGGFTRIFELNRNFRNEGISRRHNPEFTMLEAYWAYADFEQMADLVEEMICHLAEKFCGGLRIEHKNDEGEVTRVIDLSRPWRRALSRSGQRRGGPGLVRSFSRATPGTLRRAGSGNFPGHGGLRGHQQVFEKLVEEKSFDPSS